ncbi:MAG: TldD/PmbA family protein, partial [Myxococcales bacterium]|nr:TldD/PmbA family protein [Myxococcales bacterium]
KVPFGDPKGEYRSPVERPWEGMALADRIDRAISWAQRLPVDARIVDWEVTLWNITQESLYLTAGGGEVWQSGAFLIPQIEVSANDGRDTATRSLAGRGFCQQGGLEVLDRADMDGACERVPREALELLSAPQCPTQTCDLILAPDQMILQIHESIGHPLELDRILGDERNYAGTSFVTEDMFGSYRYGSDLLNVTFDPTVENELASYRFDDDGTPAQRAHLIRDGILERPLGGVVSQTRAQMPGVANSRATNWNRPAMDRMANINLEHGESTLQELISSVENGVYMETNNSWSIDDSRNKFQFGCEYGRAIRDGELRDVVRNPNYRGVSATFWRSLAGVGSRDTVGVLGSPFCGKGEPNQVIRVGHSSPTCLFRNVEVFGGAA